MDRYELARRLLATILRERESIMAAQLKQLLVRAFERESGVPFSERGWHFAKFSDFLKAQSDLVELERPSPLGDFKVCLRKNDTQATTEPMPLKRRERLTPDVWQAFTNPDGNCRRFFDRRNSTVLYYLSSSDDVIHHAVRRRVQERGEHLVEIEFIGADRQKQWMRDFADRVDLAEKDRSVIEHLLRADYTSSLNEAFKRALGGRHGPEYGRYRAEKVVEAARDWAEKNSLDFSMLLQRRDVAPVLDNVATSGDQIAGLRPSVSATRKVLHDLIDVLSDEEIGQFQIPARFIARFWDSMRQG